jgi:hypothetical protein
MKKLFTLMCLSGCTIIYSCQKEIKGDDTSAPVPPSCKAVSAFYYAGNTGIYDSALFVYNGDKVVKAESDIKLITYTYSGANISSRIYFDKLANSVSFVDSADYDAINRIKRLRVWYYPGRFSVENNQFTYLFSYKGNNLDRISSIEGNQSNSTSTDTLTNIFNINAAGNTDNIVTIDNAGNVYDSVHYTYDNNPNYFKKINPNFFLFDANFQMQGNYLHHLPYCISTNNVTSFSYFANAVYQVNYQLDSLKNVNAVTVNGVPYATYTYTCH